ncbi:MAG: FHA domain-containing protein [Rudaea sp.]
MVDNENAWPEALAAIDLSSIDSLKSLKHEQDQLSERLQSMDELKATVAEAVYRRVHEDYRKRMQVFEEQAHPLKQTAREEYAKLRGLLDRFEADHESIKLDQEELALRHKLGEFDDKEFQRRNKAIDGAVKDKAEARARALELKSRFLEAFHSESELDSAPPTPAKAVVKPADPSHTGQMAAVTPPAPHKVILPPPIEDDAESTSTQMMTPVKVPKPAAPPTSPPPPPPPPRAAPPVSGGATQIFRAARLVPQNPEAGKQSYTLSLKPMSIGAAAGNDVRIGGPGVDPKHAQITVGMGGFTIVDTDSKHGTRVNAEKIHERTLANEDVIQIGAARFVFREG